MNCRPHDRPGGPFVQAHDWRLLERQPMSSPPEYSEHGVRIPLDRIGWHEVWYCTRCRLVEEREVPE